MPTLAPVAAVVSPGDFGAVRVVAKACPSTSEDSTFPILGEDPAAEVVEVSAISSPGFSADAAAQLPRKARSPARISNIRSMFPLDGDPRGRDASEHRASR